ncbi:MAG: dienelactone hydrolase family protein [Rhodospirillaceae bacterium]|nr:dienelactone hydrolase family protein [Rhodospirillaceae bacterium]MDD9913637.1 dienelactone hydrolase family protein [Rhodospirillaceae bacterium]MDD9924958.1 dienelactone hydrolase family protein [Rhodospirillaceae bacterium]
MSGVTTSLSMRGGETVEAYMARPEGDGPWPGLVILAEIYNANHWVRAVADGYAEQGFLCLAPDLYWRQDPGQYLDYTPEGQQAGRALGQAMDLDAFTGDMADYARALADHPDGTGKVGTVGYCLGGKLVYLAVARDVVDVGVGYYAVQLDKFLDEAAQVTRPLMLHFAELDTRVPQETVSAVKKALDGKPQVEIYDYLGADHGFNRFGYPPYHPQAAEQALDRSLAFLRKHIA